MARFFAPAQSLPAAIVVWTLTLDTPSLIVVLGGPRENQRLGAPAGYLILR